MKETLHKNYNVFASPYREYAHDVTGTISASNAQFQQCRSAEGEISQLDTPRRLSSCCMDDKVAATLDCELTTYITLSLVYVIQ